jgi:hypothetical protein
MLSATRRLLMGIGVGLVLLLAVTGCRSTARCSPMEGTLPRSPFRPPPGYLFTQVKSPLTVDYNQTQVGGSQGEAEAYYVGLFYYSILAWGDSSVEAAAKNGGITKVEYADYEHLNVLSIFKKTKVIVHGSR